MLDIYQELPSYVSPIIFSIGSFSLHWYSVMWIIAFGVGYTLLSYRVKRGEGDYDRDIIQDIVTNSLIGALIGGRLGYILFYDLSYYITHPLEIISPYSFSTQEWVGIYGMSYHGGLIGVIIAIIWTARKNKKDILKMFDFIAPIAPIGYFFGRIGNFMNEELVGRTTNSVFGMYFNGEEILRHPSQLYEGFLEGIVLFAALWSLRNKNFKKGTLSALYVIGYALARFVAEYFREPDEHLGFVFLNFSMGQMLSIVMLLSGVLLLGWVYRDKITSVFMRSRKV